MAGDFGGEDANVFDSAIALGVVHAVADDELVGDLEGDVVGFDGDEAAVGFVEAGGDLQGFWFVLQKQLAQKDQG